MFVGMGASKVRDLFKQMCIRDSSSTGHMILAEQVLKFGYTEDFMEMFRVVIQLGAILAVVRCV